MDHTSVNTGILNESQEKVNKLLMMFDGEPSGTTKLLKDPYLFRTYDGSFGVIAVRTGEDGFQDNDDKKGVLLFLSDNLIDYTELGFIPLSSSETVISPVCRYDDSINGYIIGWYDQNGQFYTNFLRDLDLTAEIGKPEVDTPFGQNRVQLPIEDADPGIILPVSREEAETILPRLRPVENTGILMDKAQFHKRVKVNDSLTLADLPDNVKLTYSDGSSADKRTIWNEREFGEIEFTKPGAYSLTGRLKQQAYPFPLIADKADPNVVKYNGQYYFISTDENGQDKLLIRAASKLEDLPDAAERLILSVGDEIKSCLWAPELHIVKGRLCLFFAGGLHAGKEGWRSVQCFVMRLAAGGDPVEISQCEAPDRFVREDGYPLIDLEQGISLDMTYFEHQEISYVIWAQRNTNPMGPSELWIATVNAEEPWKITSNPVNICTPNYGWDRNTTEVDEGPYVLKHDGQLFCTFSGSNIDDTYCVGILTADGSSDLLNSDNWKKRGYPIWTAASIENQFGPGHNSYVEDVDENLVNIFHAKVTIDGSRDFGIRKVHWAADDAMLFPTVGTKAETVLMTLIVSLTSSLSMEGFWKAVRP